MYFWVLLVTCTDPVKQEIQSERVECVALMINASHVSPLNVESFCHYGLHFFRIEHDSWRISIRRHTYILKNVRFIFKSKKASYIRQSIFMHVSICYFFANISLIKQLSFRARHFLISPHSFFLSISLSLLKLYVCMLLPNKKKFSLINFYRMRTC